MRWKKLSRNMHKDKGVTSYMLQKMDVCHTSIGRWSGHGKRTWKWLTPNYYQASEGSSFNIYLHWTIYREGLNSTKLVPSFLTPLPRLTSKKCQPIAAEINIRRQIATYLVPIPIGASSIKGRHPRNERNTISPLLPSSYLSRCQSGILYCFFYRSVSLLRFPFINQ